MFSRLGLFLNVFEQILSDASEELYQYLSANSESLLSSFATHFNKISIVHLFCMLLDTPISSTESKDPSLQGPWWHDNDHLLHILLESLQSPDCSPSIELIFWSILTRGLPLECLIATRLIRRPLEIHTCDFLLSSLLAPSSSFVPSLLSIALSTPSEAVAFAAFRVLARFFWDSMKEGSLLSGVSPCSRRRAGRLRRLQQKNTLVQTLHVGGPADPPRECDRRCPSQKGLPRGEGVSTADPCVSGDAVPRGGWPMSQIDSGTGAVSALLSHSLLAGGVSVRRPARFSVSPF